MIDRISSVQGVGASVRRPAAADAAQQSFRTQLLARQQESQSIAFSKHARQRAEQRGIQVDDELMDQLSDTVEKAQAKGATNILAFDTTRAFIINVPNGRVITAMCPEEMKENIFTNIDGAVIL